MWKHVEMKNFSAILVKKPETAPNLEKNYKSIKVQYWSIIRERIRNLISVKPDPQKQTPSIFRWIGIGTDL